MHYKVLKGLFIVSSLLAPAIAIDIDGKLDFGNSHSTSAAFRSQNTGRKNTFVPVTYTKTVKTQEKSDDFEDIGVVCISGGCNTTETTKNTGDTIQTDVIVHVQTKVDLNQNKTKVVDDTPDIPVVIGYAGSKLDTTIDEDASRGLTPQSIFVPNSDPFNEIPSYNPSYPSTSTTYDHSINKVYTTSVDSHLTPSVSSRIDPASGSFDDYHPSVKTTYYYVKNAVPGGNIDIQPLSSVSTSGSDTKYKTNGIEIKVPYFESTYHTHYYGENPPPQTVWYSKKSNNFNPVEFKTVKATWTPSTWNRRVTPHTHSVPTVHAGSQCNCKNGQTTPSLSWYPSSSRGSSINDPGSQINDKLAPLN